ncbi:MAG: hypothetical protein A3H57_04980 [Candidatus Taylorbacteria bacterium RIFCSPLOWO2_02_FULL_43_11]|uniref:Uncharacterized protein n=1 Tax=Candidatus Taylorbacteria bacterium RIFCSPHIGHO2_02_FULL_43_32b TaxID=1802306 RepID=A0A1G2MLJ3_9BACT|nr:MAG: hypothetical protein A2743_02080 [Candidatus Taylorbacteria bacterium RIFCSPHIGHO2_01_FULL_43_47]OHA23901.1 MAG: hypothetical protein A3C72_01545 [Candidatus Taylorbacteria bacterium RIFCSPHIGHO2_02_FULL_43_32b]OHA30652.1 MAG: hypothetical protein A3B08_03790 [Candidatus Taylorbacteria bacterium RIFCSPLOWO2_01_FULL_43_44]OHA37367.1 MAG: hypothetical protein A3H57_04980 [Candidatus Taylorbacteria bacterium RIFCSPLOWO2_02_FULL_43_11]
MNTNENPGIPLIQLESVIEGQNKLLFLCELKTKERKLAREIFFDVIEILRTNDYFKTTIPESEVKAVAKAITNQVMQALHAELLPYLN